MSGEPDLSGRWIGIFNYPTLLPPEQFDAELRDVGGILTGLTSEPNRLGTGTLHAIIDGRREGSSVTFTKRYDDFEQMPHEVLYAGTVDSSGDEIAGTWEIHAAWSGTFLMVREGKTAVEEEQEAGETLEVR